MHEISNISETLALSPVLLQGMGDVSLASCLTTEQPITTVTNGAYPGGNPDNYSGFWRL